MGASGLARAFKRSLGPLVRQGGPAQRAPPLLAALVLSLERLCGGATGWVLRSPACAWSHRSLVAQADSLNTSFPGARVA
jgi:hypothetical protein